MNTQNSTKDPLRHRMYFWLMNASLIGIAYSAIEPLVEYFFGWDPIDHVPTPVMYVFYAILSVFIFVVPMFLICAKFMRDEYCEQLWKRTFVVLAYLVALLPFIFLVLYWSMFFALGQPEKLPPFLAWPEAKATMGTTVYFAWIAYMMLFVCVFQLLRWKDSS